MELIEIISHKKRKIYLKNEGEIAQLVRVQHS